MKARYLFPVALCALALASCNSTPASRISRNPTFFNSLNQHEKSLVQQGKVAEGMGKNAVWLAWGRADGIATGSRSGRVFERWSYAGYEPVYGPSLGYATGFGYGPIGCGRFNDFRYYPGPMMTYVPYEARRVEFTNGKVSAWAITR